MRYQLQNKYIRIEVDSKGAELQKLFHVGYGIDYLWYADPNYWGKFSPVLFPIVGTLKDDTYFFKGKKYSLSRHGFARDMDFEANKVSDTEIWFKLTHAYTTLKNYPFEFILEIGYSLQENILHVDYKVTNLPFGNSIWFSIGGHPAFRVPLDNKDQFENWYIHFPEDIRLERIFLEKGILSSRREILPLDGTGKLFLNEALFQDDAIVIDSMKSNHVYLLSKNTKHGLRLDFEGFPWFGIWKVPHAPFVCLEPWCGVSDFWDASGEIGEKAGINHLAAGEVWQRRWSVTLF
jgi:galactose mutarotase-like enzyme